MRVFLLSPASCHGRRARMLFNEKASFELAHTVRTSTGAPLGEVFSFLSGLYFRGKLTYANAFAQTPIELGGVHVITQSRGLIGPDVRVTLADLHEFAAVPIDLAEPRYRTPLERTARELAARIESAITAGNGEAECPVILLGSIASDKYVSVLDDAFGARLRFPAEFVGRGDMSRGGLLLRCVDDGNELTYIPLDGAVRHGARPPRLAKRIPR
ncbi:MAG: hypothetical protein ACREMA_08735 [Longimicrobiales bacterium]